MTTLTGAITQETARFIVETTYDDLPDDLRAESLRCIVDGIGVMLAGVPEECTQIIHRYVGSLGVTGAARVPHVGEHSGHAGYGAGFGVRKGRKCRAQSPRGLQAVVATGLSALRGCVGGLRFSTPFGAWFSHPTHR